MDVFVGVVVTVDTVAAPSPLVAGLSFACVGAALSRWDATVIPVKTGTFELYMQHATRDGLFGEYFNNAYLHGEPVIQRVDHVVNFTWYDGRITDFGTDYVSVRWTGKVRRWSSLWRGTSRGGACDSDV